MHIAQIETRSLDERPRRSISRRSPAELVLFSFTDSDLAAVAARLGSDGAPRTSIRLGESRHAETSLFRRSLRRVVFPASVRVGAAARRASSIGAMASSEVGALSRKARGVGLASFPAMASSTRSLAEASTLDGACLCLLGNSFEEGGPANIAAFLELIRAEKRRRHGQWRRSGSMTRRALRVGALGSGVGGATGEGVVIPTPLTPTLSRKERERGQARADRLLSLYFLAGDRAPLIALADALERAASRCERGPS